MNESLSQKAKITLFGIGILIGIGIIRELEYDLLGDPPITPTAVLKYREETVYVTKEAPFDIPVIDLPPQLVSIALQEELPPRLSFEYIERLNNLRYGVASGRISPEFARQELKAIEEETGIDGLIWLARRVPIFDETIKDWRLLDDYLIDQIGNLDFEEGSRVENDPFETVFDVMFTSSDPALFVEWWFGIPMDPE
jgi:hypothetical protein